MDDATTVGSEVVATTGTTGGIGRVAAFGKARSLLRNAMAERRSEVLNDLVSTIRPRPASEAHPGSQELVDKPPALCPDVGGPDGGRSVAEATPSHIGHLDVVVYTVGWNVRRRTLSEVTQGSQSSNPGTYPTAAVLGRLRSDIGAWKGTKAYLHDLPRVWRVLAARCGVSTPAIPYGANRGCHVVSETRFVLRACLSSRQGHHNLCQGRPGISAKYDLALADSFISRQAVLCEVPDDLSVWVIAVMEPACGFQCRGRPSRCAATRHRRHRVRSGCDYSEELSVLAGRAEVVAVGIPDDEPRLQLAKVRPGPPPGRVSPGVSSMGRMWTRQPVDAGPGRASSAVAL